MQDLIDDHSHEEQKELPIPEGKPPENFVTYWFFVASFLMIIAYGIGVAHMRHNDWMLDFVDYWIQLIPGRDNERMAEGAILLFFFMLIIAVPLYVFFRKVLAWGLRWNVWAGMGSAIGISLLGGFLYAGIIGPMLDEMPSVLNSKRHFMIFTVFSTITGMGVGLGIIFSMMRKNWWYFLLCVVLVDIAMAYLISL